MQNYAINNNLTPFISMQNHYNLVYREEEREMLPTLKVRSLLCLTDTLSHPFFSPSTWVSGVSHGPRSHAECSRDPCRSQRQPRARIATRTSPFSPPKNCTTQHRQVGGRLRWPWHGGCHKPVRFPTILMSGEADDRAQCRRNRDQTGTEDGASRHCLGPLQTRSDRAYRRKHEACKLARSHR